MKLIDLTCSKCGATAWKSNAQAISMIPYVAHCADRRRRSGAQTSATEVERSRTGRRSVRAQWRTPPEGEVWV